MPDVDRAVRTDLDHLSVEPGLTANTLTSHRRDQQYLTAQAIAEANDAIAATWQGPGPWE